MNKTSNTLAVGPVKKRFVVLDALRGFALLGIILANFPELSLWTFQTPEALEQLPSPAIDRVLRFLLYVFVDGKFYTIFSILFGIGFSIIIGNIMRRSPLGPDGRPQTRHGFIIFYRRMTVLAIFGLCHLLLLWSGDILLLYALMGMLLPLYWNYSDRALLRWAAFFLLLPVGIEIFRALLDFSLAELPYQLWWDTCARYGISEENFGTWLRDADTYRSMSWFLMQGAWERLWEFVDGNRYFRVLGLFLIGMYIGRRRLYAAVTPEGDGSSEGSGYSKGSGLFGFFKFSAVSGSAENITTLLHFIAGWGSVIGLPLSVVYAWSAMNGHPLGNIIHCLLYTLSVYPLGFAYIAIFALLFRRSAQAPFWKMLAYPGRMALTNYLSQSVCGIILFYGIGFGLGANVSLLTTEILALCVFLSQILVSALWLHFCQFGPLEWIWRMLTYGRLMPLLKERG